MATETALLSLQHGLDRERARPDAREEVVRASGLILRETRMRVVQGDEETLTFRSDTSGRRGHRRAVAETTLPTDRSSTLRSLELGTLAWRMHALLKRWRSEKNRRTYSYSAPPGNESMMIT